MPTFNVTVREEHIAVFEIEASNEDATLMAIQEGEGNMFHTEYVETIDPSTWTVEEL